jgi:hypothetical protein
MHRLDFRTGVPVFAPTRTTSTMECIARKGGHVEIGFVEERERSCPSPPILFFVDCCLKGVRPVHFALALARPRHFRFVLSLRSSSNGQRFAIILLSPQNAMVGRRAAAVQSSVSIVGRQANGISMMVGVGGPRPRRPVGRSEDPSTAAIAVLIVVVIWNGCRSPTREI